MKNKKIVTKSCTHPISCICYPKDENTLIDSLSVLTSKFPNIEYCYIFHHGENGDKDHYHLLMRNNSVKGFQNVSDLLKYFYQPCDDDVYVTNSVGEAVLRYAKGEAVCYIAMRQFIQTNSLGDWYKYCLHDENYLETKK